MCACVCLSVKGGGLQSKDQKASYDSDHGSLKPGFTLSPAFGLAQQRFITLPPQHASPANSLRAQGRPSPGSTVRAEPTCGVLCTSLGAHAVCLLLT